MNLFSKYKGLFLSSLSIIVVSIAILLLFASASEETIKNVHSNVSGISSIVNEINFYDYLEEDENIWFVTSVSGLYLEVSDSYLELLGKKVEEIKEELLFSNINAKDLPAIMSENSKLLLEAKKVEGLGPYRMLKNDGSEILVIFKATPVVNKESQKVSQIIFSVKDISKIVEETKLAL